MDAPRRVWKPTGTPTQMEILDNISDTEVYGQGGAGSGKTYVAVRWVLLRAFANPPHVEGLIVAPTYDMLNNPIVPMLRAVCDEAGVSFEHRQQAKMVILGGTRRIHLRSAEEPERLIALTVGYAWMDEAALCVEEAYTRLSQRVRDGLAKLRQTLFTTTPEGTKTWVARRERDGARTYRMRTHDNPSLTPEYIKHMTEVVYKNDPAGFRQYMEGIATDASGNIYTALSSENIAPWTPQGIETPLVGWDFNVMWMVTVVMMLNKRTRKLHVVGEVVSKSDGGVTTSEHAWKVREYMLRNGFAVDFQGRLLDSKMAEPVPAYIDASGANRRSNAAWTDEAAVIQAGFQPRHEGANPLVRNRIASVQGALRLRRLLIDAQRAPETLQALRDHARDKYGEPQKVYRPREFQADHYCDALGYPVFALNPPHSFGAR